MSVITVDDLHLAADPEARLARAASYLDATRLIVRVPDRQTDGVRVFQVSDIARMLQRHGRIRELAVTDGGTIVAAADLCKRRGELAIWTGWAIGPWHPSDITTRGLGGSETAAVRLAEAFAAMGYVVTLYGQFEAGGMSDDVMLRDFQEFDPTKPLDVLIGFRDARLFDHRPNAKFTALWLEDLPGQEALTSARAANIDRVCGVSHWHKKAIQDAYPWIDPRQVAACRNGIVRDYFTSEPAPERERRAIYSSSPDRGGDVLLDLWPEVREHVPDAELVLTYSRWYDLCYQRFGETPAHRKMVELLKQPGVKRLEGGLGQKDLAHLMRTCQVWAHPSWYTAGDMQFHETSCISAMEAQAAGCCVVASDWGALTETVEHGTLVKAGGNVNDAGWRKEFVGAIVQGFLDRDTQDMAQTLGPEMVRNLDWRGAAEQLAAMIPKSAR